MISFNFFTNCTQNELKNKITEDDSFWYIYKYDSINNWHKNINYCYKFNSNNNFDYMNFDFSSNQLNKYENIMNDVKPFNKWKFNLKDNTLKISNWNYKILYFSNDTIVLKSIKNSKITILINLRKENPEILKYYKPSLSNE